MMKKAVVLDGYTTNPGDLSWQSLDELVDLTVYDRTPASKTISRIANAEIIMTNKVVIDRNVIEASANLKYVGVMATGYNVVDLQAASEREIIVSNIPSYSTASVAQHVFAFILEFATGVAQHNSSVKAGEWVNSQDFMYTKFSLQELEGKAIGIIGYGTISKALANIARALRMKILATTNYPDDSADIRFVSRDELLVNSDFVTIHTVLSEKTEGMVNEQFLLSMKTGAYLINTGRGGLVDEQALADALNEGQIAGAGLDVLSSEPPKEDNPLLTARNCLITPHIAWATQASRGRLIQILSKNIQSYLAGNPANVVN
jgi:glycerate dehydrogenase